MDHSDSHWLVADYFAAKNMWMWGERVRAGA